MDAGLAVALVFAFAFAFTNGFMDAANAIATLVATRAARPAQALALASVCNLVGPLLVGSAVATTVAGIIEVSASEAVAVVASGLIGAASWNGIAWARGMPSSSGHALVGGLTGAALVEGGAGAVNWGGFDGWHPVGVVGALVALAVSPLLGAVAAFLVLRLLRLLLRRATTRVRVPVNAGQWLGSAALAASHGANDVQKVVGAVAVLLLASGHTSSLAAPLWVTLVTAVALTAGTAFGGWRIVRTIGRRIYRIRALDGLSSQSGSAAVILGASLLGAPVSTTHVVASSIVGIGAGRRRWRHVRWAIVREMALTWVTTLPAAAILGAVALVLWRWIA